MHYTYIIGKCDAIYLLCMATSFAHWQVCVLMKWCKEILLWQKCSIYLLLHLSKLTETMIKKDLRKRKHIKKFVSNSRLWLRIPLHIADYFVHSPLVLSEKHKVSCKAKNCETTWLTQAEFEDDKSKDSWKLGHTYTHRHTYSNNVSLGRHNCNLKYWAKKMK